MESNMVSLYHWFSRSSWEDFSLLTFFRHYFRLFSLEDKKLLLSVFFILLILPPHAIKGWRKLYCRQLHFQPFFICIFLILQYFLRSVFPVSWSYVFKFNLYIPTYITLRVPGNPVWLEYSIALKFLLEIIVPNKKLFQICIFWACVGTYIRYPYIYLQKMVESILKLRWWRLAFHTTLTSHKLCKINMFYHAAPVM